MASAAGDPEQLDRSLGRLGELFTHHTGVAATRRAGEVYAARTLVYEDCRRDLDVDLGPELIEAMAPPLSLLLASARWFTYRAAEIFRGVARQLHAQLSREFSGPVPALAFWQRVRPFFGGPGLDEAVVELQRRWEQILDIDPSERRIQLESVELRTRVDELFACPGPGYQEARYHSPDLMIAAESAEALARGEFQLVLGEMHVGSNTLATWLMVEQHPEPEKLIEQLRLDLTEPLLVISESRETLGQTRTTRVPEPECLPSTTGRSCIDPARGSPTSRRGSDRGRERQQPSPRNP